MAAIIIISFFPGTAKMKQQYTQTDLYIVERNQVGDSQPQTMDIEEVVGNSGAYWPTTSGMQIEVFAIAVVVS